MSDHYVRWGRYDGKGGATEEHFDNSDDADAFCQQMRDELDRDAWYVFVQHCLS